MRNNSLALGRWFLGAAACLALCFGSARIAAAQEIEPNEFVPAPDGTNLAIEYYLYGHNTSFKVAHGPTITNSGLEVNLGITRLVHYDYIAGMPAGIQVLEAYGSESGGHVGTARLGSTFGASNVNLSAFIWPYASTEKKQYLVFAGFVYVPVGSYNKRDALNVAGAFTGTTGLAGDAQIGWDMGVGEHFSYDISADFRAFSDTRQFGVQSRKDVDIRLQAWANWNWTRAFQTSIGWESFLGGQTYANGNRLRGNTSESERIRAAAALFVAPNAQVLLEVNHEFVVVSGFKQTIGATGRFVYIF